MMVTVPGGLSPGMSFEAGQGFLAQGCLVSGLGSRWGRMEREVGDDDEDGDDGDGDED